jgi:hypothetical protein
MIQIWDNIQEEPHTNHEPCVCSCSLAGMTRMLSPAITDLSYFESNDLRSGQPSLTQVPARPRNKSAGEVSVVSGVDRQCRAVVGLCPLD